MATLQVRKGSYRVLFCFRGGWYTFTLSKVGAKEAGLTAANVDRILLRLDQKLIQLPPAVDIVTFVRNDGRAPKVRALPPRLRRPGRR